jgi:hypothetical protein
MCSVSACSVLAPATKSFHSRLLHQYSTNLYNPIFTLLSHYFHITLQLLYNYSLLPHKHQPLTTMDNQTIIAQAPLSEAPHLALSEVALVNFQAALDRCLNNWNCGEGTVILQDNIPKLFGEFMFNFFKRTLLDALGEGSDLTIMVGDDGTYTRIEMSKIAPPLPQFDLPPQPPQTSSSDQSALDSAAVAAGLKKVSRPMNCWVIYRDATSKKLKLLHPDLTVQEICKHTNRTLS